MPQTTQSLRSNLWGETGSGRRLQASRNRYTRELRFPVFGELSPVSADHETVALSKTGKLYSFTIISPSPKTNLPPFAIGYVDFPEGVRVFGRICLAGDNQLRIGDQLAPLEDDEHGYVFMPTQAIRESNNNP